MVVENDVEPAAKLLVRQEADLGAAGLELRDRAVTGVRAWSQASAGGAFGIGMATRLLRPRLVREAGWDEKIEFRVWRTPVVLFF